MKRMSKLFTIVIVVVSTFLVSFATPASARFISESRYGFQSQSDTTERLLVKFKPDTARSNIESVHIQVGCTIDSIIPNIGVHVIKVPRGKGAAKVTAYRQHKEVQYAELDGLAQAVDIPDDPYLGDQWNMTIVHATEAWDVTKSSSDVRIAILDTGIDINHPDLADKVISSQNFSMSTSLDDIYGHGSHVAGIAAASTANGIGVTGLGRDASLMNVKVLSDEGIGFWSWIAYGVIWATDNDADVINLSLGSKTESSVLEDAVNYAWGKGVVVVAAAGNTGDSDNFYPASYQNCIAVAATDTNDNLASFSSYGPWVTVAAPGDNIYSTFNTGGYEWKSGTSMASPLVAGLAALVCSITTDANDNGYINDEVRYKIEESCDDLGINGIGRGRINALTAVKMTSPPPSTPGNGSIAGVATDDDGILLSGVTISNGIQNVITSDNGSYSLTDIPEGSYTITASKDGYDPSVADCSVNSGETTIVDLILSQSSTTGSISGIVTDAKNNSPLEGATVTDGTRITISAYDGSYLLTDIPEGSYTVTASKDGYESSSATGYMGVSKTATLNFALDALNSPIQSMWCDAIDFSQNGVNFFITIRLVSDGGPVTGGSVSLELGNDSEIWQLSGTTDTTGCAVISLKKLSDATYTVIITSLSCPGFECSEDQGLTSATYVLGGNDDSLPPGQAKKK